MIISNNEILLGSVIMILSIALIVSLKNRPDTSGLKQHIIDLANRNLQIQRSSPNQTLYPIPYTLGTEGPLKFYTGVERVYSEHWQKVGIIFSESKTDDTVFELQQRLVPPFTRDSFEYKVRDNYNKIEIPIPSQNGKMLHNGDKFIVPGKESIGLFVVARDTDYSWIPI